jgi:hypothetical protein
MKYTKILSLAVVAALSFTSCGNGENEETVSDTTTMETTAEPMAAEVTYYDLSTGSALHKDQASGRYVDEGGTEAKFYVDAQARDTFYGATGQNVNNAMINENNNWRVDEAKVKITEDKVVIEDEDSKLKVKEDKAKLITEDQKIKAKERNGQTEVKVKER